MDAGVDDFDSVDVDVDEEEELSLEDDDESDDDVFSEDLSPEEDELFDEVERLSVL